MLNKIKEFFKKLPRWSKIVISILIFIPLVIFAYSIFGKDKFEKLVFFFSENVFAKVKTDKAKTSKIEIPDKLVETNNKGPLERLNTKKTRKKREE